MLHTSLGASIFVMDAPEVSGMYYRSVSNCPPGNNVPQGIIGFSWDSVSGHIIPQGSF